MSHTGFRLADLAERVHAKLDGDGDVRVERVGTLEHAGRGAIAFLTHARFRPLLGTTGASAVIVAPADASATSLPKLVHPNPYATYAKVASILHPAAAARAGCDPTARLGEGARLDPSASVGPYAVIGRGARIGARAAIGAGTCVGDEVEIGEDALLHPHVTVYARCVIGPRTIVHAGAVIGADGFGMAEEDGHWLKIPQVGRVVIGADCEIGANTTIDRGAIDDTVVEDDVKLDNQIQIGHNCRIGAHSAIAGCTGIAGSTRIGRNVRIGGAVSITGHVTIADGTVIAGAATVLGAIRAAGTYSGAFPLMLQRDWRRAGVEVRHLHALRERVEALERALREKTSGEGGAR